MKTSSPPTGWGVQPMPFPHRRGGKGSASCRAASGSFDSSEAGAVTAEFAVALPAVIFLLALLMGSIATGVVQLQLEESARVGARAAARGEAMEDVRRVAQDVGTDISVVVTDYSETVTVQTSRQAPGLIGEITGWTLYADSTIPAEPAAIKPGKEKS